MEWLKGLWAGGGNDAPDREGRGRAAAAAAGQGHGDHRHAQAREPVHGGHGDHGGGGGGGSLARVRDAAARVLPAERSRQLAGLVEQGQGVLESTTATAQEVGRQSRQVARQLGERGQLARDTTQQLGAQGRRVLESTTAAVSASATALTAAAEAAAAKVAARRVSAARLGSAARETVAVASDTGARAARRLGLFVVAGLFMGGLGYGLGQSIPREVAKVLSPRGDAAHPAPAAPATPARAPDAGGAQQDASWAAWAGSWFK